jgi:hypothetical protein
MNALWEKAVVMFELLSVLPPSFLVHTNPMSSPFDWVALVMVFEVFVVRKVDSAVGATDTFVV